MGNSFPVWDYYLLKSFRINADKFIEVAIFLRSVIPPRVLEALNQKRKPANRDMKTANPFHHRNPEVAIVGAGPYGLSLAAHCRGRGISFRIFGRVMDSWVSHMPKGMMLKSDSFASNLSDAKGEFTLKRFCGERGIPYSDSGYPVSLETFVNYGRAFQKEMVPELEEQNVVEIERIADGFGLRLEDGETLSAQRVVLAVGITHYEHMPSTLSNLPAELVSHSACHHELDEFQGKDVVVLGAGASATGLAALLNEAGAKVRLLARDTELKFHNAPSNRRPPLWWRIRNPQSGLGPGIKSWVCSNLPGVFHALPASLRVRIVRTHLGPSGAWMVKDKVIGKVPLVLGFSVNNASIENGKVKLQLRGAGGSTQEIFAEHVIAATGYHVDIARLKFLSDDIRKNLNLLEKAPILSSDFESSIPGLYFVGLSAAYSFGPVMRFAYGAEFASRRITKRLAKVTQFQQQPIAAPRAVPVSK